MPQTKPITDEERRQQDAILDAIFAPNIDIAQSSISKAKEAPEVKDYDLDRACVPEGIRKDVLAQEAKAVALAEAEKYDEALDVFNSIINQAPDYASALNNRAQTLRLMRKEQEAMADLDKAVDIAKSECVKREALTQRAMLKRLLENNDGAMQDFRKAADMGEEVAQQELIKDNPYAKMCSAMVNQVMGAYRPGSKLAPDSIVPQKKDG
eukprot:Clim_evm14s57 gene=Clim_evmTU14s57